MPRSLSDYSVSDWLRLRPPLDAVRARRIGRATDGFARQSPRAGDLDAAQHAASRRKTMVTIAFNDAEILGRQIRAVRRFVPGPTHVVADNSSDDATAAEIEELCHSESVHYLRLPANPWGPRSPSRSHGAALNWVWRRLIQPAHRRQGVLVRDGDRRGPGRRRQPGLPRRALADRCPRRLDIGLDLGADRLGRVAWTASHVAGPSAHLMSTLGRQPP